MAKRKLYASLIAFVILILPHGAPCAELAEPSSPLVRVGAYENYPKIYTSEEGDVRGLFPEILEAIAHKEGWRLEYVHGSWTECLERLEKNEIDIMPDVAFSKARNEKYDFNDETILTNWGVLYAGEKSGVQSLVDLDGKKVAVMRSSIHTEGNRGIKSLLKNFNIDCEFLEVDDYEKVFALLDEGKADAGVVNRIFGSLEEDRYNVHRTPVIFNPRQIKFAFSKSSDSAPRLSGAIDRHVRNLKQDPRSIYFASLDHYLSGRTGALMETGVEKPSKKVFLTPGEKAWAEAHPVIRVGIDPEFAPFEFKGRDNAYGGISSDYIEILNKRCGLNLRVVPELSWSQVIERAREKKIDVLSCVGSTEERRTFLRLSKPYIRFHRVIITRGDFPFVAGLEDIQDLLVAVQAESSHEGFLRDNTEIRPVSYPTLQEALTAVADKRVDAFVGNIASSTYWIRRLNLTNLKVAAPVLPEVQTLHFAVRKDWPELVSIINKGLASITPEEENRIYHKWVSVEVEKGLNPKLLWTYVFRVAAVALLLILVMLLWNFLLKREILRRKEAERELAEANAKLKELDNLKSMFIASMSHELRTPLNSILGFTGIILGGMAGDINEEQKDQLERVYGSARHLLALITDVIDISKIESGSITPFVEEFGLSKVIEEAVAGVQVQLKAKGLRLEVDVPDITLETDRRRLFQCVLNYLSNAVRYSEGGVIRIRAREEDGMVTIRVSDNGIGIPEKDIPKLFTSFSRLESPLKIKNPGTGLGLYLTRKMAVDILGGSVDVSSTMGVGSDFYLGIPKVLQQGGDHETGADH